MSDSSSVAITTRHTIFKRPKHLPKHCKAVFPFKLDDYYSNRVSALDRTYIMENTRYYRGFHTMLWSLMVLGMLTTIFFKRPGSSVSFESIAGLNMTLPYTFLSVAVSSSLSFVAYFIGILSVKGYIRYYFTGLVIHYAWLCVYFYFIYTHVMKQSWHMGLIAFFYMQSMVIIMKMHSFLSVSGELSDLAFKRGNLAKYISEENKDESALSDLKPEVVLDSKFIAFADTLKNEQTKKDIQYLLAMDTALQGSVTGNIRFPDNVSIKNFFLYLWTPVLLWQVEYPLTEKIRVGYVFEKLFGVVGTLSVILVVYETYVLPIVPLAHLLTKSIQKEMSKDPWFLLRIAFQIDSPYHPMVLVMSLVMPCVFLTLFMFYMIFECYLNLLAELTWFGDRQFYVDWWNSMSYLEFSSKWNTPVHDFLKKHVFIAPRLVFGISGAAAGLFTFALSSLFHELLFYFVTKKPLFLFFLAQMSQIPLSIIYEVPLFKRHHEFCNFWVIFGLMIGPPVLITTYTIL